MFAAPVLIDWSMTNFSAWVSRNGNRIKSKMAARNREKRTSITTVRDQYLSSATFPTPLIFHYPLPLRISFLQIIFATSATKCGNQFIIFTCYTAMDSRVHGRATWGWITPAVPRHWESAEVGLPLRCLNRRDQSPYLQTFEGAQESIPSLAGGTTTLFVVPAVST